MQKHLEVPQKVRTFASAFAQKSAEAIIKSSLKHLHRQKK